MSYIRDIDRDRVVANSMVFLDPRDARDPVQRDLDALMTALSQPDPADVGPREARVVELPAGRAVRVHAVMEIEPDERGAGLPLETVQFWVPLDGMGFAFILSCSTPSLGWGAALVEDFDAMASTLGLADD